MTPRLTFEDVAGLLKIEPAVVESLVASGQLHGVLRDGVWSTTREILESDLELLTEAARIEARVRNILACDYPRERLEILIASDGSDDGTHALVERLAAEAPVRLFVSEGRVGKTETQNRALREARGEIVVPLGSGRSLAYRLWQGTNLRHWPERRRAAGARRPARAAPDTGRAP